MRLLLKTLVASAFLQYTTTAIAMPWEVGKLLLQVQWVPRDAVESDDEEPIVEEVVEEVLSDDSAEDSYFADPTNANASSTARYPVQRPADERGYVIRKNVLEEATQPDYLIPIGSADGVWGMIKKVGRFRSEGWLSLWKGLLTSCLTEVASSTLQPLILAFLQALFTPSTLSPYHQPSSSASLLLPVASQLVSGFVLSPLDLVRTRLIVQSSRHRRYSGPIDALHQIIRDEGGFRGMYFHPHLLLPTIIDSTLRPIISLTFTPFLAGCMFPGQLIAPDTHPIAWGVVEFGSSVVGLLATLPFETVRRRLQAQTRGRALPLKTCVETRPAPYNGVVDTLWHILTEERSDLPIERRRTRAAKGDKKGKGKERDGADQKKGPEDDEVEESSWWRHTGLGQLYRGLGMRVGAGAIMVILAMVSGGDDMDAGWAEL